MNKIFASILLGFACLTASAQHERVTVETSPFARNMLKLDTGFQWISYMLQGSNFVYTNFYNFIGGTNISVTVTGGTNVTYDQIIIPKLTAGANTTITTNHPQDWTIASSTPTIPVAGIPPIVVTQIGGTNFISSILPTNANWINIKTFGATPSPADSTAAFQNAAYFCATNPAVIYVDPLTPYSITNIVFTNNTKFYGFGSCIQQIATANGPMITIPKTATNVLLYGIIMDGQQVGYNSTTSWGFAPWFEDPNTNIVRSLFGPVRERSGVTFYNLQTNSAILYCSAINFADRGFIVDGQGGAFVQPRNQTGTIFSHNTALNDWIGLNYTNGGEYMTAIDWHASYCGYGVSVNAGNDYITDGEMTGNGIALYVNGGANSAHGSIANFSLNHNVYSMAFCNSANGFEVCNLHIAGDLSLITITNFTGLHIEGGQILPVAVIVDVGGSSTMGFNHIVSSYFDTSLSPILGGAASFFKIDACFNGTQNAGLPYLNYGSYIRYPNAATNTLMWMDQDGLMKSLPATTPITVGGITTSSPGVAGTVSVGDSSGNPFIVLNSTGVSSKASNGTTPAALSPSSSPWTFTWSGANGAFVITGGTVSAVTINGTTVPTTSTASWTPMAAGDVAVITYTGSLAGIKKLF